MQDGRIKEVSVIQKAGSLLLDLLYPRRCPVCHDVTPFGMDICKGCRARLPYIESARCRICSKPVEDGDTICEDCAGRSHYFEEGLGLFLYDHVMRETMSYLKFKGRQEYGQVLGRLLASGAMDKLEKWKPDAFVPVPLHKSRLQQRTYNQAELIAAPLSSETGIPIRKDLLLRSEETRAMKKLGTGDRKRNLYGAFRKGRAESVPDSVILVDDIYTTGATMDACARVLKEMGCRRIYFLAVCIGTGFMVRY